MLGPVVSKAPFGSDILRFHDLPSWKMACDAPVLLHPHRVSSTSVYLLLGSQPSSMKRKGEMLLTRKKNRARKMVSLVLFPGFGMPLLQQAKLSLVCGLLFSPVAFLHVLEGAAPSLAAFSPSSSSTPTSSKLNKGPQLFNSQGFPVEN